MEYGDDDSPFYFPLGLPAFEEEKLFVAITIPDSEPLVFLQSARTPELCFLAFPIQAVQPEYHLALSPEDFAVLGGEGELTPRMSADTLVLTLLSVRDGFPVTANLMAPVIINPRTRRAVQSVRQDAAYSHQYPISAVSQVESTC